MEKEMTIEQRVAETVLERTADVLVVDGTEYPVAPPTLGTILALSGLVSRLPAPAKSDGNAVLADILAAAPAAELVARIAATLILGAKAIKEDEERRCLTLRRRPPSKLETLTRLILDNCSPATVSGLITRRLSDLQLGDFFGITASLGAVNLLRPTVEAETPSGDGYTHGQNS